jgi:hypothetical protein
MHRDQVHAEDPRPDRIAQVRAPERLRRLPELCVDRLEDRLLADARPRKADAVVLENELAVAAVVAHDEVGLRVADRSTMRTAHEALQLAFALADQVGEPVVGVDSLHRGGCGERLRRRRPETARHGAFLDHDAVVELGRLAKVDDPRDRRADGARNAVPPTAPADAVDLDLAVVAEPQHVAVPGEPLTEAVRQGKPALPRAEQDLGRAERPCGEDDHVGRDRELGRVEALASGVEQLVVHEPTVVPALHGADGDLREDGGPVVPRVREVVHQHRVLRGVVAAGDAVAAQPARLPRDPDVVDAVFEGDVDGRAIEPAAGRAGRALERVELLQADRVGKRCRPEHLAGVRVALREQPVGVRLNLLRPDGILEDARIRFEGDVRVHERRAAEPAADENVLVGVHVEVVQARP